MGVILAKQWAQIQNEYKTLPIGYPNILDTVARLPLESSAEPTSFPNPDLAKRMQPLNSPILVPQKNDATAHKQSHPPHIQLAKTVTSVPELDRVWLSALICESPRYRQPKLDEEYTLVVIRQADQSFFS
jgi:hypothetical protein